jgi:hypothetical protein
VNGSASYDDSSRTISFTPSQALNPSTAYTATLSAGLHDVNGTALAPYTLHFTTGAIISGAGLSQGRGGPILVVTDTNHPWDSYLAEMLRAEGITYFDSRDISTLDSATLNGYTTILLGKTSLSAGMVTKFSNWVQSGGNLIAIQPDKQLAGLLGLVDSSQSISNGYLKVDTTAAPGNGISAETMQFHQSADLYATASTTTTIASLYSNATTPLANPAVTSRNFGYGHAAAFTYDLPQTIVQIHQGNKAWAGQDSNGDSVLRPSDLVIGNGATDWLNAAKAHIPQADEQQRLLTNMIMSFNSQQTPLPKFWILPHGYKTALVMTEDDHATSSSTWDIFDHILLRSADNCSVSDWQCQRSGSLLYTASGLTAAQAAKAYNMGFSIGNHIGSSCTYSGIPSVSSTFTTDLTAFRTKYNTVPNQKATRMHCFAWPDWDSVAKLDVANGMRFDLNYVWYPRAWTGSNTGYVTGSGMTMRFTDASGNLLDVYQGASDLDYETDPTNATMNADLDNALGSDEFYGVFGTHYDQFYTVNTYIQLLTTAATSRGIQMISPEQMLAWKDGLGSSSFSAIGTSAQSLSFNISVGQGGAGMQAMVPAASAAGQITSLKHGLDTVTFTTKTIKGISYAVFDAAPGNYQVLYGVQSSAPQSKSHAGGATDSSGESTISGNSPFEDTDRSAAASIASNRKSTDRNQSARPQTIQIPGKPSPDNTWEDVAIIALPGTALFALTTILIVRTVRARRLVTALASWKHDPDLIHPDQAVEEPQAENHDNSAN